MRGRVKEKESERTSVNDFVTRMYVYANHLCRQIDTNTYHNITYAYCYIRDICFKMQVRVYTTHVYTYTRTYTARPHIHTCIFLMIKRRELFSLSVMLFRQ